MLAEFETTQKSLSFFFSKIISDEALAPFERRFWSWNECSMLNY